MCILLLSLSSTLLFILLLYTIKAGHPAMSMFNLQKSRLYGKKKIITGLDTYRKYNFPKYINKEDGDNISFCI